MTLLTHSSRPGFAEPVHDAQRTFRAVLDAMARPTHPFTLEVVDEAYLDAPAPLSAGVAAVVLTLCDEHTPIWIDADLTANEEVGAWLRFHTGARLVADAGEALFVIASSPELAPPIDRLAQGSDEEPHQSATLVIDATEAQSYGQLTASGPGVNGEIEWDGAGLPEGFLVDWQAGRARFPRGVDVLLVAGREVRALPRTTALRRAGTAVEQTEEMR